MVDSEETSTIMDISTTEVTTKKHPKTKRKASPKPPTPLATPKKVANKEKALSSKSLQHQANKAVHKIMMTVKRRRLKLPIKRSDLLTRVSE